MIASDRWSRSNPWCESFAVQTCLIEVANKSDSRPIRDTWDASRRVGGELQALPLLEETIVQGLGSSRLRLKVIRFCEVWNI